MWIVAISASASRSNADPVGRAWPADMQRRCHACSRGSGTACLTHFKNMAKSIVAGPATKPTSRSNGGGGLDMGSGTQCQTPFACALSSHGDARLLGHIDGKSAWCEVQAPALKPRLASPSKTAMNPSESTAVQGLVSASTDQSLKRLPSSTSLTSNGAGVQASPWRPLAYFSMAALTLYRPTVSA